jgi:uncharacterized C2H2 Zn-finger protein
MHHLKAVKLSKSVYFMTQTKFMAVFQDKKEQVSHSNKSHRYTGLLKDINTNYLSIRTKNNLN